MPIARPPWLCLILLIVASLCSGCGATPDEVTVWIDAPLPGGRVNPGEEVPVQTHAYSASGVVEIELTVDGQPFSREAPQPVGADLVTLTQTWIATSPGMHTLQVTVFNANGAASSPAAVVIEVLGPEDVTPVPMTATVTPTLLAAPITVTVAPAPSINFNADDSSIAAGECTFLRWQVQNAASVTLNGSPVGNPDARQVCPSQTTGYVLRAVSAGGERSQTLEIDVSIPLPQDTTGPVISNLTAQPASIFDNPSCGADRAHITARATDVGSGVKQVDIYYRVVMQQAQSGQLTSRKMYGNETQGFDIYLGSAELKLSLGLYGGGTVQYYLVAVDNAGNSSQSGTSAFQTQTCIF